MRRMVSAGMRQKSATASGVKPSVAARISSTPFTMWAMGPRSRRPSSKITLHSASRKAASAPGRIGSHSLARSAVPVRRGSMTTTLPPRSRMASISPSTSGQLSSEPPDACGLPPMITQ